MNITKSILTNSSCYKAGRSISPQGIMTHSTATPGGTAKDFISYWNQDISACTHFVIDNTGIYQLLPENHRAWHAGSPANDMYISYEICEPGNFSYNGQWASMGNYNPSLPSNQAYFQNVYEKAVWLSAYFCKKYGWDTDVDHVLSHNEGFKKGVATAHLDVGHWFPKHGKSMDIFRKDVKAALGSNEEEGESLIYRIQVGAFKDKKLAESMISVLKKMKYDTFIKNEKGYYKVQVGAFKVKANADALLKKLKKDGFEAFLAKE